MKKTTRTTAKKPTTADLMQMMLSLQQAMLTMQQDMVSMQQDAVDFKVYVENRFNLFDRQFSNLRNGMDNRFDEVNLKLDKTGKELGETIAFITQQAVDQAEFAPVKKAVHRHERALTQLQRQVATA